MKKSLAPVFAGALLAAIAISCSTVSTIAKATNKVAEVAGETGAIDKTAAESISKASESVASASEAFTPEQEYYIGRAVAGTILNTYKLYSAPSIQAYLNKVCGVLVVNSPNPELYNGYCVAILDTDEINAFATSGGHILVTRGLLKCANSEDELAAVLAHEISHIQLGHSIKAIKTSRIQAAIKASASSTAIVLSQDSAKAKEMVDSFDASVGDVVSTMVNSGYSQSQEFEADKNALSLMASAGYDPNAMRTMLELLQQNTKDGATGFGKTHPTPEKRISKLGGQYGKYSGYTPASSRSARFGSAMKGLR